MLLFSDDVIRAKIAADLGDDALAAADADIGTAYLPFPDVMESTRQGLAKMRAAKFIAPATTFHGYVYDVKSGKLIPAEP
jgi:hypothetical protein